MIDIRLAKAIPMNTQKNDSIIIIESIRDFILSICNGEPEIIYDIINYKSHSMPSIIYSRPWKNQIRIFSIGDHGRIALNAIFANIISKGYIKIKNERYAISGTPKIISDIQTLPICDGSTYTYTTLTPLNVFNKHNHKVFLAIASKYFENGKNIKCGTIEQRNAFFAEISIYINEQIRDSIKYFLSSIISSKKKEDFVFVDSIEFEWENIDIIFECYHTDELPMPMVIGKFQSNFLLPKFLGYKIGKGFGELSMKEKTIRGVA